ncbi:PaaX family transcriptional regulator C-terminal domain-containing protein [Pseudonocardia sp. MH-G8]|uniref:PaaX family transcriptional regulator n=1 Tax=Pseudonocardia sp. MH-G8 TaxID=1854588 RepID=UPI000BA038BD|nr:PaaX family transcriptional regulator C-terminal domain-containing protein [Pseudonocardia sp. MH-G8]OZM76091.1 PaaX family transcriptional regulator [Pseudonocardia sp. MH-G8]
MAEDTAPRTPPRPRLGPEPQRLLIIVLGDYWYWRAEPIPSQALIAVLGEFAITPASARVAIRRLTRRGLVQRTKVGRTTSYGIPPRPSPVIVARLRALFDADQDEPWDGRWTGVAFSVPEKERESRRNLRDDLRLQGFGPLFDGLWVSPRERRAQARAALERHAVDAGSVFRAELDGLSPEAIVARAFDLSDPAQRYRSFADRYEPLRARVHAGELAPREALRVRTELTAEWRRAELTDPRLPAELLPPDWPRARARECCTDIYDQLGEPAARRFRHLLAQVDPALAELASFHTFESVRRLPDGAVERPAQESEFERVTREDRVRSIRQA